MSGQTLNDRLTAARHALAGQGLARIVCKATTEEVIGPKKKHLDYLLHCTNEPNVSIPQLANLLIERTQNASWVVVFKALITVHHLMCYGNERFTQYLASSNCTFQLGCFLDKVGVQSYDMSTFIRRYAKYLNEKAVSYRTVAFDFCKCKRGKEDGILRQMNTEQLLKTLPALQAQLDSLLEFDCSTNDLCNGVVNSCFMLLFRDLVRLFACYNDGIINLLGKYFDMNKKHARDALDIYKKFLIRMDRVAEFLKVAENIGIEKSDIPDLTKAPSSLLEALEQHLATLEGRKGSTSAASAAARATNVQNAVIALSNTSLAFCSAGENSPENGTPVVDESVRKAVEEEAEVMNQLKFDNDSPLLWEQPTWEDTERRLKEMTSSGDIPSPPAVSGGLKTNPFLSSPSPSANQRIIDLFNTAPAEAKTNGSVTPASDDLLNLGLGGGGSGNPFADSLFGTATGKQQTPQENNAFAASFTNGFGSSSDAFASDASFAAAFGDSPTAGNQESAEIPALPSPAPAETSKLSLPVLEQPFGGGRSNSPSPTAEQLMRGAGTTPILAHAGGFGDHPHEDAPPPPTQQDFTWGGSTPTNTEATAACGDLFGDTFEPPPSKQTPPPRPLPPPASSHAPPPLAPPTAVVTPLSIQQQQTPVETMDLFGFDSEVAEFGEQPMSAQHCAAPPPSPFGGLDFGGGPPDLRAQAIANAVGVSVQQPKPSSGLEDLDFAITQSMGPKPSPTFGSGQSPFPCMGMMGSGTPPASSTPGYGTPTSGMSSPARPVAVGASSMPGGFDAFGETLQPHAPPVAKPAEKSTSFLKGDLDSTLASLASNLDINGPKTSLKKTSGHQWSSPKPVAKAGTAGGWTAPAAVVPVAAVPPNMNWSASPQHGGYPQMGGVPTGGQWGGGVMGGVYPQQAPSPGVFQQQQFMGGNVRPPAMGSIPPMQQQPFVGGFTPQVPLMSGGGLPTQATSVNDPFGAL